jgi:hypothetical protein
MKTTMDHINKLSAERSELYRLASNGHSGDTDIRQRIQDISSELDKLWQERRRELVGRREGIDGFVDRVYERLYGRDYDNAVAPVLVSADDDRGTRHAA